MIQKARKVKRIWKRLTRLVLPSDYVVCFIHMPKNAGTSVRHYVLENERKENVYVLESRELDKFAQLSPGEKKRINVVMGHFPYAYRVHEYLPKRCRYSTVLRNPRERVLSFYSYIASHTGHRLHSVISSGVTLEDFLRQQLSPNSLNGQVRLLCNAEPDYVPCTKDMLEQAKENLEEQFEIIGFSEEMESFYRQMNAAYGWDPPIKQRHNVTSNRIKQDEIPDKTKDLIDECNQFDWELYEFAKQLVARRAAGNVASKRQDFLEVPH